MTDMSRSSFLWLAITVTLVLVVFLPQLETPFELQDDHRIIEPLLTPHPAGVSGALRMWAGSIHDDVVSVGRFRPVNQFFDVVGPLALGPHPLLWHGLLVTLAVAVAVLLFHIGWVIWRSAAAAAMLALVTMLAPDPGPTAAWYRLGPKESWDMLLVAAALAVMVHSAGRRRPGLEALSFALVVLAALSKEPFILLLPALFGVRWWLESRLSPEGSLATLRRLRSVAIAYALVFSCGLAALGWVVHSAGSHSYGGKSMAMGAGNLARVLVRDLAFTPMIAVWFVPALLALVALAGRSREQSDRRRAPLLALVTFLAWVVPQYLLYATRGGFWDHYWLPCLLALAALNAGSIDLLQRRRPALGILTLVVLAVWLANAVRIDLCAVRNFKVRSRIQQAAVHLAAQHLPEHSVLLIVANTDVQSEVAPAFAEFARVEGARYQQALWCDSRCGQTPCSLHEAGSLSGTAAFDPHDIAVVVYLDVQHPLPPPLSLLPGDRFEQHLISGQEHFLSLRRLRQVAIPFTLRVDVRRT